MLSSKSLVFNVLIVFSALSLSSCNEIKKYQFKSSCIKVIKERLKSPSTFKLDKFDFYKGPLTLEDYKKYSQHELSQIEIESYKTGDFINYNAILSYDADNSFGASIRNRSLCEYTGYKNDNSISGELVKVDGFTSQDLLVERINNP